VACRIPTIRRLPLPQPHTRPAAMVADELDASGCGADVSQEVIARCSRLALKLSDRRYSNLACLGQRILGPIEKSPRSSTLRGHERFFDRVKRDDLKLYVRERNRHNDNRQHISWEIASKNVQIGRCEITFLFTSSGRRQRIICEAHPSCPPLGRFLHLGDRQAHRRLQLSRLGPGLR
jgi:hypothetical protein